MRRLVNIADEMEDTDPDADLRARVQPVMAEVQKHASQSPLDRHRHGECYDGIECAAMLVVAEAVAEAYARVFEYTADEDVQRLLAAAEALVARLREEGR